MKRLNRGILAVFEGIDGSGKSTLARMTAQWLETCNVPHTLLCEPTKGLFGTGVRKLFEAGNARNPVHELAYFIADRVENCSKNIRPALNCGLVVLLDRYYQSTVAYQAATGVVDPRWVKSINESFAPIPDIVFLFDLDPQTAMQRIKENRNVSDEMETIENLNRVRQEYLDQVQDGRTMVLDAQQSLEDLMYEISRVIYGMIMARGAET